MSATEPDRPKHDGDDILAAEFVLGVLPGAEQAALAYRVETDGAFAQRVAAWTEQLSPLNDSFAEGDLPPAVKLALDQRMFGTMPTMGRRGWWNSLALWRGLAGAATLAALLALALPRLALEPDAPGLVASLSSEASDIRYLAFFDQDTGRLSLAHVEGVPDEGRSFELWVIAGDAAPVSLGVIPSGNLARITPEGPARALLTDAAAIAITVEPPGGSPTGQPTGAVVAAGDLRDI